MTLPDNTNKPRKKRDFGRMSSTVNSIVCDAYDIRIFETIRKASNTLKKQLQENKKKLKHYKDLQQDIFSSMFKYCPQLERDMRSLKVSHRLHYVIMEIMMNMKEYKEIRSNTTLDELPSAIATEIMGNKAAEIIDDLKKQFEESEHMEGGADGEGSGGAQGDKPVEMEIPEDWINKKEEEIAKAMRNAFRDAKEQIEELGDLLDGWGTDSAGLNKMPPDKVMELAERIRNNPKLRELAKLIGRFRRLAITTQRLKITKGADEIYDITQGNNVNRLLGQEKALLTIPELETLFYIKHAEKKLMEYDLRAKEKLAKGPIVCALDESGSMSGEKEIWAKAVAIALLEIAISQNRKFAFVHFSSNGEYKTFLFEERPSPEKMLDMAEWFYGGGTDFETPLKECRRIVDEDYPRADIVFITDGECDISDKFMEDFIEWKEKSEVHIFGVMVDSYHYESKGDHPVMDKFCDDVMDITSLSEKGLEHAEVIFNFI